MICHAKRLTLKWEMDKMEAHVKPLVWVLILCLAAIAAQLALDTYADNKYQGTAQTADLFAQCLNGTYIDAGSSVIVCSFKKPKSIGGLK